MQTHISGTGRFKLIVLIYTCLYIYMYMHVHTYAVYKRERGRRHMHSCEWTGVDNLLGVSTDT